MPTFCRHGRFLERCPICSKTLPEHAPSGRTSTAKAGSRRSTGGGSSARSRSRAVGVRVRHETRAVDDGFRSELVPGLRASADAERLAAELAFSSARLLALATEPPGLYGEARALAGEDLERATWTCLLIAYLSPLQSDDPFAGIRLALAQAPAHGAPSWSAAAAGQGLPDLSEVPLGPRSSHDPARGAETLSAYAQWVERGGTATPPPPGAEHAPDVTQARAFTGDPGWSPERRFERLFERLALPGFGRMGRYELLVVLGRLGLYPLRPDSLHLASARGLSAEDPATLAAKRVFGIGDPLLLERRAAALAEAAGVPVEALDLALANWAAPERATLGFPQEASDEAAQGLAEEALGL
jgi:hypothetical protein